MKILKLSLNCGWGTVAISSSNLFLSEEKIAIKSISKDDFTPFYDLVDKGKASIKHLKSDFNSILYEEDDAEFMSLERKGNLFKISSINDDVDYICIGNNGGDKMVFEFLDFKEEIKSCSQIIIDVKIKLNYQKLRSNK